MIDLPNWIDKTTWNAWLEMRKKMHKSPTDYAMKLAVVKLYGLWELGNDPKEVLEQSILCGYQGLFPIHQGRQGQRDNELNQELRAGAGPVVRH